MDFNNDSSGNNMSTPRPIALEIPHARQEVTDATVSPLSNTPTPTPHCPCCGNLCSFCGVSSNKASSSTTKDRADSSPAARNINSPVPSLQADKATPVSSQPIVAAELPISTIPWVGSDMNKQAAWAKYVTTSLIDKYIADPTTLTPDEADRLQRESNRYFFDMWLNDQERIFWTNPALDYGTIWALRAFRYRAEKLTLVEPISEQEIEELRARVKGVPELLGYHEKLLLELKNRKQMWG